MAYSYDTRFTPPFPVLPVQLYVMDDSNGGEEQMAYLDTGADATLVPSTIIHTIGVEESYTSRLRSHWGEYRDVSIYMVDMKIAGETLPGIEVIADDLGKDLLIGRNVLNRLLLLFDGYRQQIEVLTRYPEQL